MSVFMLRFKGKKNGGEEMEVLHISDLHLDRAFEGLTYLSKEASYALQKSSAVLLDRILQCIDENQVELVLIVGDTFHQAHVSYDMQRLWVSFLERCLALGATPCVIFGNHDYYDESRYFVPWPDEVMKWTSETVETKYYTSRTGERVALSGFSYCHPHLTVSKIHEFPHRNRQMDYHLGLYHGQMTGTYAPFQKDEMIHKAYDYFALGHIHRYTALEKNIVYPGTLQGKKQGEWDRGRAVLLHLSSNDLRTETLNLAPIHYEEIPVTYEENDTFQSIIQSLSSKIPSSYYTLISLHIKWGVAVGDIAKEELYSNDFKRYLSKGVSVGDTASVVKVRFINEVSSSHLLPRDLREELYQNYQSDDIFQGVGEPIFTEIPLHEEAQQLLTNKAMIIKEALQSLEEDLGGEWS